jgi:hypothetical protein
MLDVGRPKLPKEKKKTKFINVAFEPQTAADFATACTLRGVSMSGFIRQQITQLIREEKTREPEAFEIREMSKKRKTA